MADSEIKYIKVPGLGEVPRGLNVEFEGICFDGSRRAGRRDEGGVSWKCKECWGSNDTVFITANQETSRIYILGFFFKSSAPVKLFEDGTVIFHYDAQKKSWSMDGVTDDGSWKFCDPKAALGVVVGAMNCFQASKKAKADERLNLAIQRLVKSIEGQSMEITNGVTRHDARYCEILRNEN